MSAKTVRNIRRCDSNRGFAVFLVLVCLCHLYESAAGPGGDLLPLRPIGGPDGDAGWASLPGRIGPFRNHARHHPLVWAGVVRLDMPNGHHPGYSPSQAARAAECHQAARREMASDQSMSCWLSWRLRPYSVIRRCCSWTPSQS